MVHEGIYGLFTDQPDIKKIDDIGEVVVVGDGVFAERLRKRREHEPLEGEYLVIEKIEVEICREIIKKRRDADQAQKLQLGFA